MESCLQPNNTTGPRSGPHSWIQRDVLCSLEADTNQACTWEAKWGTGHCPRPMWAVPLLCLGTWERWGMKLRRGQHTDRLTNTECGFGRNKTTPGCPVYLKLHPFSPPLFAPGPVAPFGSKPAGLLSSFWNQLGRFPTGGCFRPGSQDTVSHKIVISVPLPALGQGGALRTVSAALCASGFHPSREAVPKMSSEEEHCFPQRRIPESCAKQMATQQEKSQAGNFQGDLCPLGPAVGRRCSLSQAGLEKLGGTSVSSSVMNCAAATTAWALLEGVCQPPCQHPPRQNATQDTAYNKSTLTPPSPETAPPRHQPSPSYTSTGSPLPLQPGFPTCRYGCAGVSWFNPASSEALHSCSLVHPPWGWGREAEE